MRIGVLLVGGVLLEGSPTRRPSRARCDAEGLQRSGGLVTWSRQPLDPRYTPTSAPRPRGPLRMVLVARSRVGDRQSRPFRGRRGAHPRPEHRDLRLRGIATWLGFADDGAAPGHAATTRVLIGDRRDGRTLSGMRTLPRRLPREPDPGYITPDGCAVDLDARLPVGSEPEPHCLGGDTAGQLLELGAAPGGEPCTRPTGFRRDRLWTSPQPCSPASRAAQKVCTPTEDLHLDQTFDAVVLGSFPCTPVIRCLRRYPAQPAGATSSTRRRTDPGEGGTGTIRVQRESTVGAHRSGGLREDGTRTGSGRSGWSTSSRRQDADLPVPAAGDAHFDTTLGRRGLSLSGYLTTDGPGNGAAASRVPANSTT